jgi:hypothetical protein
LDTISTTPHFTEVSNKNTLQHLIESQDILTLKSYLKSLGDSATSFILYKNLNKQTSLHTAVKVDNHLIINILLNSLKRADKIDLSGLSDITPSLVKYSGFTKFLDLCINDKGHHIENIETTNCSFNVENKNLTVVNFQPFDGDCLYQLRKNGDLNHRAV